MSDTDNLRRVEVRCFEDWVDTQMKDLKKDDIFRMTEPGESVPFGTWVATEDANKTYPGEDGKTLVWGIRVDTVEL